MSSLEMIETAGCPFATLSGSSCYSGRKRKRQAWHDERREKDRQEPLSCASERDDLTLGRVEGQSAAQVSAVADLQGVMSGFDWYLDRFVHFERPDTLTVDHDIEVATTDLHLKRDGQQSVVEVEDDGPGMESGDGQRAFERFWRGNPGRSGPGRGLGLSIVAGIVAAHHGSVEMTTTLGRGTRVRVILRGATRTCCSRRRIVTWRARRT